MKKIITTMAMACLSFSCFAESYFVKIAKDEYVLQHGEKAENIGINKSGFGAVAPVDAVYTPTHIFTYPDGTPSLFRNIQKIEYTESKVTFVKDMKGRGCYIDIKKDQIDRNKCRIIGVNGHNIGSFEVYEAAEDANSFTDSKSRLIFVDHSGLYIVEKDKNSVEDISKKYFMNRKFDFKGEIIKISAVDGSVSDESYEILRFNYRSTSVFATPVTVQIEKITGVLPQTPPPNEKAALKRMAEILDIPVEMLIMKGDEIHLIDTKSLRYFTTDGKNIRGQQYIDKLRGILPLYSKKLEAARSRAIQSIGYNTTYNYPSEQRRKEIAQKPWDE